MAGRLADLERAASRLTTDAYAAIGRATVRVIVYLVSAYAAWRAWRS